MAAKASALLVYNNNGGVMTASTLDNVTFPVLFLSNQAGKLLKDLYEIQPVTLHVTASGETSRKSFIVHNTEQLFLFSVLFVFRMNSNRTF